MILAPVWAVAPVNEGSNLMRRVDRVRISEADARAPHLVQSCSDRGQPYSYVGKGILFPLIIGTAARAKVLGHFSNGLGPRPSCCS